MEKVASRGRLAPLLLLSALMCGAAPAQAAPVQPAITRPAAITPIASRSVILALARAGDRIVAVGERGIVLKSDDDGKTWRQGSVPVSVTLTGVQLLDKLRGWAVGHGGVVLRTDDGGATWRKQFDGAMAARLAQQARASSTAGAEPAPVPLNASATMTAAASDKPFFDVYFRNASEGFIVGAFGLMFRTQDGGNTWSYWSDRLDNKQDAHLYAILPVDGSLYVAGELGSLFQSTDGGVTFTRVTAPYAGSFFGLVAPATATAPVAVGLKGNAVFNDGQEWHKSTTNTGASFSGATRLGDGTLLATTSAGTLMRSRDGGRSFEAVPVPQLWPLTAVLQASDGAVILAGLGGLHRLERLPSAGQRPREQS